MRETVRDWQTDWIKQNGTTNDLEVIIEDSSKESLSRYVYEGSFSNIRKDLLYRKVIENGQIIESSVPERIGAYSLMI